MRSKSKEIFKFVKKLIPSKSFKKDLEWFRKDDLIDGLTKNKAEIERALNYFKILATESKYSKMVSLVNGEEEFFHFSSSTASRKVRMVDRGCSAINLLGEDYIDSFIPRAVANPDSGPRQKTMAEIRQEALNKENAPEDTTGEDITENTEKKETNLF